MGIKGLMNFLAQNAPASIKETTFPALTGRRVCIDASMSLYQFMIAIQTGDNYGSLTNDAGEVTSHISGILSRVVRLLENGIRPVYVFDGKPPELKSGELMKRSERRREAEAALKQAIEEGNDEDIKKLQSRTVKVTKQHNDDIKELLGYLGVPVVQAKHDAESQCAKMVAKGMCYAVGTEDLDALTFGANVQVRHLNFTEAKSKTHPVLEIHLEQALKGLGLTMEQFVEFCILCGCDFCDTIRGIGPQTAFKWIKEQGSMEKLLNSLDKTKYSIPENFDWETAKEYFLNPPLVDEDELQLELRPVDEEGLKNFLVTKHSFAEKRVENVLEKLKKSKTKVAQTRLENFFGPVKTVISEKKLAQDKAKRDAEKAVKAKVASEKRKAAQELAALHKKRLADVDRDVSSVTNKTPSKIEKHEDVKSETRVKQESASFESDSDESSFAHRTAKRGRFVTQESGSEGEAQRDNDNDTSQNRDDEDDDFL